MTESLLFIRGATTYDLHDLVDKFFIGQDNWGMPPVERITDRAPLQDGVSDRGYFLDPRVFRVLLVLLGDNLRDLYSLRDWLVRVLRPTDTPLQVRHVNEDRTRQIDCHYSGNVPFDTRSKEGFALRLVIEFFAPDPTWYDPAQKQNIYSVAAGSGLAFPVGFPVGFTSSLINEGVALAYVGSWRTRPVIQLVGPLDTPRIENTTTGARLELEGYSVAIGETVTIDLTPGAKSVLSDKTVPPTDLIGTLSDDSDLGSFWLEAEPEVAGGINNLTLEAGGANEDSQMVLTYKNRYAGI